MKRTDIRYLRTEKMIFDALTDLLSEKPYDKITVQDIADRAMICCLLYTSPSPRDGRRSRMPSSA